MIETEFEMIYESELLFEKNTDKNEIFTIENELEKESNHDYIHDKEQLFNRMIRN